MAATLGVSSLTACNKDKHTHAYNWTTDSEATCVREGHRTGICGGCGDVKSEIIPVDPDAHEFSKDWTIEKYPTESEEGKATRVCANSNTHTFEATLPEITDDGTGYVSSKITVKPHYQTAGNRHFVFAHEAGDVEFDIVLPAHDTIEGLEDIVYYAASLHGNIRQSEGNYIYGDPNGTSVQTNSFSNYYGDNYTRVHDGGNRRDFWYSLDENGDPFGISAVVETVDTGDVDENGDRIFEEVKRDPQIKIDTNENDLLGFGYESGGGMQMTYGAEDTLLTYYEASQEEGAIKFESDYDAVAGGGYRGTFSFSRMELSHFCRYSVEFTTFESGEIKTLSVRTKIIRAFMLANTFNGKNANSYEIIYDSDGDIVFGEIYEIVNGEEQYEGDVERNEDGSVKYEYTYVYETDENGKPVLKTDEDGNPVIATDEDGNEIKHTIPVIKTSGVKTKPDGSPLMDGFGNDIARPVPLGWQEGDDILYYYEEGDRKPDGGYYDSDHEFIAIRTVDFTQTLKNENDEVEENPFPSESLYIHSFDVSYKGSVLGEGDEVQVNANDLITLDIENVAPADTAKLDYDPLGVYLKTESGDEITLSYTGQNAYNIIGYFSMTENKVVINAKSKGDFTIVLRPRGGKCEREVKLKVAAGIPTGLRAQAYLYSDAGGVERYSWTNHNYENAADLVTLYVGESLYVRALPLADEASFVDASFVSHVPSTFADYFTLEDGATLADGTEATKITAKAITAEWDDQGIDVYVELRSVYDSKVYTRLLIKVVAAPDISETFTGTYTGRFNQIRMKDKGALVPADVTATFNPDASGKAGKVNLSITSVDKSTTYTCVYTFTYDGGTNTLSCVYESGKNGETFDFKIRLNARYKISIEHTTYVLEDETRTETIVLSKQA